MQPASSILARQSQQAWIISQHCWSPLVQVRATPVSVSSQRDVEKAVPDPAAPVVLYCGGGFRSALAADNLQKMGYTNVSSMDGGWRGWTEKGYPTER